MSLPQRWVSQLKGGKTYPRAPKTCCLEFAGHLRLRQSGNRPDRHLRLVGISFVLLSKSDRRTQPVEALSQTAIWPSLLTCVTVAVTQDRLDCNAIPSRTTLHTGSDSIDNAANLVAKSHRKRLSSQRMGVCGNERGPSRVLMYIYECQPCFSRILLCYATDQYRKFLRKPASV